MISMSAVQKEKSSFFTAASRSALQITPEAMKTKCFVGIGTRYNFRVNVICEGLFGWRRQEVCFYKDLQ